MKIDSVKPGGGAKKATYLSLIAVVLFLAWLNYAVGYNHMPVKGTIWALTPPIMAISLALITKEVYSSFSAYSSPSWYRAFRSWILS